ncbi:MAG TPA: FG-GAP-like repeat-containing protein, partial [Pirellulales bacterium]|nr:FG-GAP-like repeat-containing protein [Pirellulales bacterium]
LSISLAVLAAVSWRAWRLSTPLDELLEQARQAMADERYDEAETLCRRILSREPNSAAALLLAGEAAAKQERLDEAADYYGRVADDDPQAAVARLAAGSVLLHTNHAAAAERALRACLDLDPHQPQAHERLAWLLGTEGRRFESLPHLYELLRLNRFTLESLRAAGNHDVAFGQQERLRAFLATEPGNVLPLIGLARLELRTNPREAGRLAEQVVAKLPEQLEAQALLGRARLTLDDRQGLAAWQAPLPAGADEHPDIWLVRGQLAKESGETQSAARCFWEALRRDANHQAATYQLSQVLQSLRASPVATAVSSEDVAFLATRAVDLEKLAETLDDLQSQPQELELIRRAASLSESLGRLWESWAWHRVAQSLSPDAEWAIQGTERIEPQLSPTLADTLASSDPGQRLDLSAFPFPTRSPLAQRSPLAPQAERRRQPGGSSVSENAGGGEGPSAHGVSGLHFREVAAESGIDFTYFRGCQAGKGDGRIFEFTGGGVAVLDFDLDGWPDLYFTQGCRWPPVAGQSEFLDQCYRNLGGRRSACVTDQTHLVEDRFSQGATVGDFNGDGFPDIYVANIGVNRLLMNCGDGTFLDVTSQAGIDDSSWTTSCLLADLNGDGLADLYDVNYVMGDDVFDRVCLKEGQGRTCPPGAFTSQPDRFMLNLGDGRFGERGKASGLAVSGGNGLGIVAADFEGRGRLGLFVANDQDANFYFVNQATARDGPPRFTELGVLSGLAFDGQGKAQACMGVAV